MEKETTPSQSEWLAIIDSYFEGSQSNAMAALLQSAKLTEEQYGELAKNLEQCRGTEHFSKKG